MTYRVNLDLCSVYKQYTDFGLVDYTFPWKRAVVIVFGSAVFINTAQSSVHSRSDYTPRGGEIWPFYRLDRQNTLGKLTELLEYDRFPLCTTLQGVCNTVRSLIPHKRSCVLQDHAHALTFLYMLVKSDTSLAKTGRKVVPNPRLRARIFSKLFVYSKLFVFFFVSVKQQLIKRFS